ncbi:MAG: FadR family transcriptional regulator [Marinosulfonomonas sp.]|nr:FadR family transcriptional regulator [Marinosulfonomonas sp.]
MTGNGLHTLPSVDVDRAILGKLLQYIRSEGLQEGARLPSERDFATRLDVGRNKLREVLSTLETLRVIEMRPQSGMYLRQLGVDTSFEMLVLLSDLGLPLTRKEVVDSMEVRFFLEVQAIKLAATRHTQADLDGIAGIIERQEARVADNTSSFHEDQEFHLKIVQATGNDIFVRITNSFFLMTMARRKNYFSDKDRSMASIREHKNLLAAIQSRDPEQCADLMGKHITGAQAFYLDKIGGIPAD